MITRAIKVYGKVQNVGFRFYTKKKANELGLSGFVKNMTDGSVYIEVTGSKTVVEQFIVWCHSGTNWARVEGVKVQELPYVVFKTFSIK